MKKTLGLIGDGDDLALIKEVERTFNLCFEEDKLRKVKTVGDFFEVIWSHLHENYHANTRCMNAMSFFRLRKALHGLNVQTRVAPSIQLEKIAKTPKKLNEALYQECGLNFPFLPSRIGVVSAYLALICFLSVFIVPAVTSANYALIPLAFLLLSIVGLRTDPGRFQRENAICEAIREIVCRNYGLLAQQGGRVDERSAYVAFLWALGRSVGVKADQINRDTFIMAKGKA